MYFGVEHVDSAKTAGFTHVSDRQLENDSNITNEYLLGPKIKVITADIKVVEWTVCEALGGFKVLKVQLMSTDKQIHRKLIGNK